MPILYSTHCPKCQILEKKLGQKGIEYTEVNDMQSMLDAGLQSVPWLEVDGQMMDFNQANKWINEQ